MSVVVAASWDLQRARAMARALSAELGRWWDTLDCFDRPSLRHPTLVTADRAIWAAWGRQDVRAVAAALAAYGAALAALTPPDAQDALAEQLRVTVAGLGAGQAAPWRLAALVPALLDVAARGDYRPWPVAS